jgi:hypothetical protein
VLASSLRFLIELIAEPTGIVETVSKLSFDSPTPPRSASIKGGMMLDLAVISALSSILVKSSAQLIADRLVAAKTEYKVANPPIDSPLEVKRRELILKLSSVQNNLMLTVYEQKFLERVLPLLVDQTISAYEAQSAPELTVIEMNLGQIEGVLGQYNQRMKARNSARSAAIIVCVVAMLGLFALVMLGPRLGLSVLTVVPILAIPLPVILWSAIGSFTAILYRFNSSGDIELQDPLRWLFTRPLTGIMIGVITFFIVKAGLISLTPGNTTPSLGSNELMWLAAFLVGFSDRFSDSLLRSLVGRFGGDKTADLISLQNLSSQPALPYISDILDRIAGYTKQRPSSSPTVATISEAVVTKPLGPESTLQEGTDGRPALSKINLPEVTVSHISTPKLVTPEIRNTNAAVNSAPQVVSDSKVTVPGVSEVVADAHAATDEGQGQSTQVTGNENNGNKAKENGDLESESDD